MKTFYRFIQPFIFNKSREVLVKRVEKKIKLSILLFKVNKFLLLYNQYLSEIK
jgi:hypothetical protein